LPWHAGEHFGTLLTLSSGEKKRPFTAITATMCELAIISRVGYNRILKKQLQGAIAARIALLQVGSRCMMMAMMADAWP
jgi:hypothetical protein